MRDDTKIILNEIIKQWCENKTFITVGYNQNNNEVFTVVKNVKNKFLYKRRMGDKLQQNIKVDSKNLVCIIEISKSIKSHSAFVYFKTPYSIDNDCEGMYEYLKKFLAIIISKIRQTSSLGIKVHLGLMSMEQFDIAIDAFTNNKKSVVNEYYKIIYKEKNEKSE